MRVASIFVAALIILFEPSVGCSSSPSTCTASSDCGSGQGCYYPIGKCPSQGLCLDIQDDGCLAVNELCACDGTHAFTGCNYPQGYSDKPSDGTPISTTASCAELLAERDASDQ